MNAIDMKKILVVDDNREIREVITWLLEMEGYIVKGLDNGRDVASNIDEFTPDLIILDVMLGDVDGRDICNNLKHQELTAKLPIIMISASHDPQRLLRKSCHPNDFLPKPFDIQCLLDKVEFQLAS
ncbi:response regulator with a winged-helix DNA-binding domain [Pedobacter sp. BAL39]|nr:response regulator with a winged-helix DNA-binding domain [Pedobacter sp. BAL39]